MHLCCRIDSSGATSPPIHILEKALMRSVIKVIHNLVATQKIVGLL